MGNCKSEQKDNNKKDGKEILNSKKPIPPTKVILNDSTKG